MFWRFVRIASFERRFRDSQIVIITIFFVVSSVDIKMVVCTRWAHMLEGRFANVATHITKTYLYNIDPLERHFYIVKLGFTGVYIMFLISQKHRLWVLVRTASTRRF